MLEKDKQRSRVHFYHLAKVEMAAMICRHLISELSFHSLRTTGHPSSYNYLPAIIQPPSQPQHTLDKGSKKCKTKLDDLQKKTPG